MESVVNRLEEYPEAIMSNFGHEIDEAVAEAIAGKPYYAQYSGWNFCCYVSRENLSEDWRCEVWVFGSLKQVVYSPTLLGIMEKVCEKYGDR